MNRETQERIFDREEGTGSFNSREEREERLLQAGREAGAGPFSGREEREERLLQAGREAGVRPFSEGMEREGRPQETGMENLQRKYSGTEEKIYTVTVTIQVDDDTDEEFTYLFRKPKPTSYDRYVKTISNSVTKASKSFVFDNIVDEQRQELKETVEEYPAITISLADKLLRMLGLADTTSVKKL